MLDICLLMYVGKQLRKLKNDEVGTEKLYKSLEKSHLMLEKLSGKKANETYISRLYRLFNEVAIKYLPPCDNELCDNFQPFPKNLSLDDLF